MKKMLAVVAVGGLIFVAYKARKQIQAAALNLRDRVMEAMLNLALDDEEEDEPVDDVVAAFEAGEKGRTESPAFVRGSETIDRLAADPLVTGDKHYSTYLEE